MGTGITNTALSDQLLSYLNYGTGSSAFFDNALSAAITLFFTLGAIVFLGILMVGGIQWITSGGDKVRVESARGRVTSAIIGLAILLSVFAVVIAIEFFFGVNLTSFNVEDFKI